MTKSIQIKNVTLGSGIPKICVPLTSRTREGLCEEAKQAKDAAPDLIEWRADFYEELTDAAKLTETLKILTDILDGIPLIFTIRTTPEGGQITLPVLEYARINTLAAQTHLPDLIDVEAFGGEETKHSLIHTLRNEGALVIASSHNFTRTPSREALLTRFRAMDVTGADILKIAVMPQTFEDVTNLMNATHAMTQETTKPLISMSMGAMGSLTRLSGELYGSALTFATVTASSAPGQLPVKDLRPVLTLLHTQR